MLVCYVKLIKKEVWSSQSKIQKVQKSGYMHPLFGVYVLLVVIIREGCTNFRKYKSMICYFGRQLQWYMFKSLILRWFFIRVRKSQNLDREGVLKGVSNKKRDFVVFPLVTFLKTKIACFEDQRRLFKRSRGFSKGRFFINQSLALFNFILHLFTNIKLSRTLFNFSITPLLFNAHFYSIKKKDQPHDQDQTHSHFKLLCNPSITIYIYILKGYRVIRGIGSVYVGVGVGVVGFVGFYYRVWYRV